MNEKLIKKTRRVLLLFACLLTGFFLSQNLASQTIPVKGNITDGTGEPIIGASVVQKGSTNGSLTDLDGNFTLQVPANATLVVSYLGFATKEVPVNNQKQLSIQLSEDSKLLDEVVVVGYGTQKKVTLTGAIASVSSEDIITTKNENVKNMLTGKVAGLRVTQNTSQPGSFDGGFDIRGFGRPLVVIDGIPRDNIDRLDPNDIESLTVLKDAAAAVYGVQAANGVVLITTKRGKSGTIEISYTGSYGIQTPSGLPKPLGPVDYMTLKNEQEMHSVENSKLFFSDAEIEAYRNGTKRGTNWGDAVMKNTAPQTEHNLSATGGSEKMNYFVSLGYLYQDGFNKAGGTNYDKYTLRSNVTGHISKRLTVDVNLSGTIDEKEEPWDSPLWTIRNYWRQNPLQSVYANDNPNYFNEGWIEGINPVASSTPDVSGYRKWQNRWYQSTINVKYQTPIEGLQVRALGSYDSRFIIAKAFKKEYHVYKYDEATQKYNPKAFNSPSTVANQFYGLNTFLTQFALEYNKTFGSHTIGALGLVEQSLKDGTNFYAYRELSIPLDELLAGNDNKQEGYLDRGVHLEGKYYPMPFKWANIGWIGRVNYDYLSKYLLEFSFRYDGSSKFPKKNRWGFFPSVSGGWRVSEENFIKNSSTFSFIENLKIRASYGILGDDNDDNISNYQFVSGYNYPAGGSIDGRAPGHIFDGTFVTSSANRGIPNPNLTWLESKIFDIGVDFSGWNGLFGFTFDYFNRNRTGLFARRYQSLPDEVGAGLPPENLEGDVNKGFEVELSHRNRMGDFQYSLKGIFSVARVYHTYVDRARAGNSWDNWRHNLNDRTKNIWWGKGADGRYTSWDQIYNSPTHVDRGILIGDYRLQDWNGDGIINGDDDHPIGYSSDMPLSTYGLTIDLAYKGFDVNILFQGSGFRNIKVEEQLRIPLWGNSNSNALEQFMDRWHPADPKAYPYDPNIEWVSGRFGYTGSTPDENSKFNLENASYLRLKSIELGYTIPSQLLAKMGMKSIRIFANGYNIVTWSGVKYVDPEHPSSNWGYMYPLNKKYTFGVNVKF